MGKRRRLEFSPDVIDGEGPAVKIESNPAQISAHPRLISPKLVKYAHHGPEEISTYKVKYILVYYWVRGRRERYLGEQRFGM